MIGPPNAAPGAKGCVLVVDDENDILDTLTELVEMAGCLALVASNGEEALKILAESRPCLVILDLLMPVMSGTQLIEEMKKRPALADIPVLISTSAPERAPAGIPLIPKPIDIRVMWDWMRRTCHCVPDTNIDGIS